MKAILSVVTAVSNETHGSIRRAACDKLITRFVRLAILASIVALCAPQTFAQDSVSSAAAAAPVFVNGIRPQDEIVLLNVRNLCGTCDSNAIRAALGVETYAAHDPAGHRHWQQSDLQSFLAFDPSVRTIFFVHGNQIAPGEAKSDGINVYRRLICYGSGDAPIRFVIFSWPSSKVGGLLRDVREKAARTGPIGCELAWVLDEMPAETPVSLLGFSYGSRIITGSLHILAGGSLNGMMLKERAHPNRAPVNVSLLATAMPAYWLGENQFHGRALSEVDDAFFVNSCNDPAMRFYHLSVPGRGGPQALGLNGPTNLSAEQWAKVSQCEIGARHDLYMYLSGQGVLAQIWDNLSGTSSTPAPAN